MRKAVLVLASWGLLSAGLFGQGQKEVGMENTALLIIDIQNFYFEGGRIPLVGSVEASLQAKKLLEAWRARKLPVIHIQHLPKNVVSGQAVTDPQYFIHENVAPQADEKIIGKHCANSFRETELKDYLAAKGIRKLLICGMQTHMCVEAAIRTAADLGFEVTVAEDACATRNLKYKNTEIEARIVQAAVLAALKDAYARILTTDEILKSLGEK